MSKIEISLDEIADSDDIAGAVPFTRSLYARRNTLSKANGKLYGNFELDFTAACSSAFSKYFDLGAVVSITNAGQCSSGDAMAEVVVR